jgi:hypothetical protein
MQMLHNTIAAGSYGVKHRGTLQQVLIGLWRDLNRLIAT